MFYSNPVKQLKLQSPGLGFYLLIELDRAKENQNQLNRSTPQTALTLHAELCKAAGQRTTEMHATCLLLTETTRDGEINTWRD